MLSTKLLQRTTLWIGFAVSSCGDSITNNYYNKDNSGNNAGYTCEDGVQVILEKCCPIDSYFCLSKESIDFIIDDCTDVSPSEYPDPFEFFRCMESFCEGTNKEKYSHIAQIDDCEDLYLD